MNGKFNSLQTIVTMRLPITATKGARIKAACLAGSITVSASQVNGDNGEKGFQRTEEQHQAVAKMLQKKYSWNNELLTARLPNGDYVHVMLERP